VTTDNAPTELGIPRLALSDSEAAKCLGVGKTKLRELIAAGDLRTFRIDRRLLVPVAEIEAFIVRRMAEAS